MFTHIMVGANDPAKSVAFYNAALGALGIPAGHPTPTCGAHFSHNGGNFGVGAPANGEPATYANGGTIGFRAESNAQVDAFHAAGIANGGSCEGAPGKRGSGDMESYGAYLRDPDGNKICAFVWGG